MGNTSCCDFDKFLKAMTSETRQQILLLLSEREMCVTELYETLDIPQPTMSHQLGVLHQANLVLLRRDGHYIFYRVNPACVAECCHEMLSRFTFLKGKIRQDARNDVIPSG